MQLCSSNSSALYMDYAIVCLFLYPFYIFCVSSMRVFVIRHFALIFFFFFLRKMQIN